MKYYLIEDPEDGSEPIIHEVESSIQALALWNLRGNAALEVCLDLIKRSQPQRVDMSDGIKIHTWTIPDAVRHAAVMLIRATP